MYLKFLISPNLNITTKNLFYTLFGFSLSFVLVCVWLVVTSVRQPTRFLCPWNSPGKNTGGGNHSLLQGIFPTQESNLGLQHFRQILCHLSHQVSSAQFSHSVKSDSLQPHGLQHTRLSCPSLTPRACSNSHPSSRWCHPVIMLCRPLPLLPSIPPSIRVFSNESTLLMRWPEYWSFSFSISPSKEIPGLISFRMDWLGLLAV